MTNGQWDQATTWSDGATPSAGNAYVIGSGIVVTSPPTGGGDSSNPFNGGSLTVQPGGTLQLFNVSSTQASNPTFSIPGLVLDGGGTLSLYGTGVGNSIRTLTTGLTVSGPGSATLQIQGVNGSYASSLYIAPTAAISGSTDINVDIDLTGQLLVDGGVKNVQVSSANNPYSGNWTVTSTNGDAANTGALYASAVNALGTGTVTLASRSRLVSYVADSLDSLSGVNVGANSVLQVFANWNSPNASLALTDPSARVTIANTATVMSIGNLTGVAGSAISGVNSAPVTLNTTADSVFAGDISGSLYLTKTGPATQTLSGTNTINWTTTINEGTLQIGAGGTTGSIAGGPIIDNAALAFNRIDALTYAGTLSGTGTVIQAGTGVLTLTGSGTNIGSASVNAGTLNLAQAGAFTTTGAGGFTTAAGGTTQIASGSTLTVGGTGAFTQQAGSTLVIPVGSTLPVITATTAALGGTLDVSGIALAAPGNASALPGATFNLIHTTGGIGGDFAAVASSPSSPVDYIQLLGAVSANTLDYDVGFGLSWLAGATRGNGIFTLVNPTDSFNVDVALANQAASGTGWDGSTLTKNGAGTLVLSAANTYTGATQVNAGTLRTAAPDVLADSRSVNVAGGATLDLDNFNQTVNALSGAGSVTLGSATLTANNDVDSTFGGVIGGGGSLVKTGVDTLTLGGANSYTGGTTINGGTLQIGAGSTGGSVAGDITNNAALVFNRSDDVAYAGVLSGSGSLAKQGTGVLTLSNGNSSQGSVNVAQGTLQLVEDGPFTTTGNYTTAAGATTNIGQLNSTLRVGGTFTQAAGSSLDMTLGASPDIVAQNAVLGGTLTVNGFSESATPVKASEILAGQDYTVIHTTAGITGNFSNNPLTPSGLDYLLYSGFVSNNVDYDLGFRLAWTEGGASAGTGSFTMGANSAFDVDIPLGDQAGPFASGWDGKSLTKNGDGLLILSAANTYTGSTTINAGTLRTGAVNAFASSSAVSVASGATLDLNGFDQLANNVSGAGDVTLGSALLTADNHTDTTFSGTISGTGGLAKTGTGALDLTGTNTFTGATTVSAGRLSVNGSLANSAVSVMSGATLGGNGTVGATTIQSGGTVAPGNSIGTLNVAGNFTQAPGSVYQAQVNPNSTASDLVKISGTATLQSGAVLQVSRITPGEYSLDSRYTVLSAAGGLSGTYSLTGDTSGAFYQLIDSYDAHAVYLTPEQVRSFTSAATTPNQRAVSGALQSLPAGNALRDAVGFLSTDAAAQAAFNQLAGDSLASTSTQLIEDSHFVRDAANDRLRQALCSVGGANTGIGAQAVDASATPSTLVPLSNCNADRPEAWAQVFGSWGSTDGNGDAGKLGNSTGGFFAGTDMRVFDSWRAGVLAGYSQSSFDVSDRNASGTSDNYDLGIYGGTQWGNLGLRLGTTYTWHSIDSQRSVVFPGYADQLSASYDASTTQAFGELGWHIDAGKVQVEPFANLAYVRESTDGFSERGSFAALTSSSDSTSTTFSTIGARATTTFSAGGTDWTAHGTLGWRHAFGDTLPASQMAFPGSTPFTVSGVPIARDAAVVELGVQATVAKDAVLDVSYAGQMGNGMRDNGVRATLNWKF